ncbi:MAG: HAD-IA family hydrolase, partial [Chloroflexota bacterium]
RLAAQHGEVEPAQLEAAYLRASKSFWSNSNNVPKSSESGTSDGNAIRIEVWNNALSICGIADHRYAVKVADFYTQERRISYRLFPEVEDVLKIFHERFAIGVITNGTNTQREKIENTSLGNYIDLVIISGEVGVGKPEAEIFTKALSSINTKPKEAIYVGDSLELDIAGAKNAGLYAIWLNRNKLAKPGLSVVPDSEITNLRELLPMFDVQQ